MNELTGTDMTGVKDLTEQELEEFIDMYLREQDPRSQAGGSTDSTDSTDSTGGGPCG